VESESALPIATFLIVSMHFVSVIIKGLGMNKQKANGQEKDNARLMHERIIRAFDEVPKFEGFTTRDLSVKIKMPEPKSKVHLD
jgi:hypothetical protein